MENLSYPDGEDYTTADNTESNQANYTNSSVCLFLEIEPVGVVVQILMSVAILVLNGLVIGLIVYNSSKTFRKPSFIFIIALSTADMFLSLNILILAFVTISQHQLDGATWAKLTAVASVSFNVSVNFLLIIAFDRLLFIAYNRRYNALMNKRSVKILVVLSCLVGTVPVLPLAGGVGLCTQHCQCEPDEFLSCNHLSCSRFVRGFSKSYLFGLFFYFSFMLIAISGIYFALFRKVRQQGIKVSTHTNDTSSRRMKREYKLARTLGIVVVIFFICWCPITISYVIDFANADLEVAETTAQIITIPSVLNSVLNPIIYAARIPILKNFFVKRFRKSSKDSNSVDSSATTKKGKKFFSKQHILQSTTNDFSSKRENERRCSVSNAQATGKAENAAVEDKIATEDNPEDTKFVSTVIDDTSIAMLD